MLFSGNRNYLSTLTFTGTGSVSTGPSASLYCYTGLRAAMNATTGLQYHIHYKRINHYCLAPYAGFLQVQVF